MSDSENSYLDNSYTIRQVLTGDDIATGKRVPATRLTMTAMLADAQTVSALIHADPQITLAEVGSSGEYLGTIDGDAISVRLEAYIGQRIYEVVTDGASLRFVTLLRVRGVRAA